MEAHNAGRVIVLDTETTGFSPALHRIVEIGAVEVMPRSGTLGRPFRVLVNPLAPIPPGATRIHGLRDDDVRAEPHFGRVAPALLDFVRGATLAIHNSSFDLAMLDAELARHNFPALSSQVAGVVDTLALSRELLPALASHKLDALCDAFAVDRSGRVRHGALLDAQLVARLLPAFAGLYDRTLDAASPCSEADATLANDIAVLSARTVPAGAGRAACVFEEAFLRTLALREVVGAAIAILRARYESEFGFEAWACAHLATTVRPATGSFVSYAQAARALLLPEVLARYTKPPVRARSLEPVTRVKLDQRFGALTQTVRERRYDAHGLIAGIIALERARKALDDRRALLRTKILEAADRGEALRHTQLSVRETTPVDYKLALAQRAPEADLTPFMQQKLASRAFRARDFTACVQLFGAPLECEAAA